MRKETNAKASCQSDDDQGHSLAAQEVNPPSQAARGPDDSDEGWDDELDLAALDHLEDLLPEPEEAEPEEGDFWIEPNELDEW